MEVVRLTTQIPGLTLRSHVPADAVRLRRLLAENADHLMSSGDYGDEIATTAAQWRRRFAGPDDDDDAVAHSFGMWLDEHEMVGRIVLVPVARPVYGLGYWVAKPQQGKGFASAAVRAVIGHAAALGATEVSAGVNHGNAASRRVLEKCGFAEAANLDTYTRFRRPINPSG